MTGVCAADGRVDNNGRVCNGRVYKSHPYTRMYNEKQPHIHLRCPGVGVRFINPSVAHPPVVYANAAKTSVADVNIADTPVVYANAAKTFGCERERSKVQKTINRRLRETLIDNGCFADALFDFGEFGG
jgi:hypothetical protein